MVGLIKPERSKWLPSKTDDFLDRGGLAEVSDGGKPPIYSHAWVTKPLDCAATDYETTCPTS